MKIIVAQGNPGFKYRKTRHNVGFGILDSLNKTLGLKWVNKPKFNAKLAEASINGSEVVFIKPETFYNQTGQTVKKFIDYYKLEPSQDLLVIHDDIDLPFGTIRIRQNGSDGGNKGLKSIISQIGPDFSRVRVGTSNQLRSQLDEASFVLLNFEKSESEKLKKDISPYVFNLIEQFCEDRLTIDSVKL